MAVFNDFVITNNGRKQYAKVISGDTLTFTKAKLGTGKPTTTPTELNDIVSPVVTASITSIDTTTVEGQARITIEFSNEGMSAAVGVREVGIFCKNSTDNTEVMYAYAFSENDIDTIPSAAHGQFIWKMTIALELTNAQAETGGASSAFVNFTPSVAVTPSVAGSVFVEAVAGDCRFSKANGMVSAFYNLSGTLYSMVNSIDGIASFKISLPTSASLNAPVLCNLVVNENGVETVIDAEAKVNAANDVIEIQYFGTVNGTFALTALAQYLE